MYNTAAHPYSYHKRSIRKNKKSNLIAIVLVCSIILIVVFSLYKTTLAKEDPILRTYYKTIVIQANDTLWDIAERYNIDSDQTNSEYIAEVKRINGFGSDNIKAGMNLIVPYYAE